MKSGLRKNSNYNRLGITVSKQFCFANLSKNSIIIFCNLLIILFLFVSCANIVSPSGGPRDIVPPKIVTSYPSNYSTNFKQKKVEIIFNEYIVLKDIHNQLIVSPPFKTPPEIKVKGKSLLIEFKENFKENSTYTLFFGDAITDLNEGNAMSSFEFVFSTGNVLDSLSVMGKVIDAFTQKPEKDVFVMLYNKNFDSIPYKEVPYYMAKTKEDGSFTLNNLKDTTFKLFAIKETNNNYLFDQAIEKIAYYDSLIIPHFKPIVKNDSILLDSLKISKIPKDSLKLDSIKEIETINKLLSIGNLYLFQEIDSTQKILKTEFKDNRKVQIEFKYPVKNLKYKILNKFDNDNWKIDEWSINKDILTFWLLKPDIDSLSLILFDNSVNFADTLHIFHRKSATPLNKNILKSNLNTTFNYFEKVKLNFLFPVLNFDSIPTMLIVENDTNRIYAYAYDATHRSFNIMKTLMQNTSYKLIIKDSVVKDINSTTNDSLIYTFKTNSQEDLGNFAININAKDSSNYYIIQLINEKDELINEVYIKQNQKIVFNNLQPGNYQIKAIKDRNKNKKWDTGYYLKKIQPEETIFYPSKITIRANWDLEENWSF